MGLAAVRRGVWQERASRSELVRSKKGALRPLPLEYAWFALLLNTGIGSVLGALIESGEHRIVNLLAVDQLQHHARRLVSHLERPLADERVDAPLLGDGHFVADRIGGDDDKIVAGDPVLVLVSELTISLRSTK